MMAETQTITEPTKPKPPRLHVRCLRCEGWDAALLDCPFNCGVKLYAEPPSDYQRGGRLPE